MPLNAMWIQCIVVVVFVALVSFGGDAAAKFFSRLVLMTNVAMTLPYMFLSGAFVAFKNNKKIVKPFQVYKNRAITWACTILVTFTVGFANFFTIIQPATQGNWTDTIWMMGGPLFFSIVAFLMYERYDRHVLKK